MKRFVAHPTGDFVYVMRIPDPSGERMTEGGVWLPGSAKPDTPPVGIGVVEEVGPMANQNVPEDDPSFLRKGDRVVFCKWPMRGAAIKLDRGKSEGVLLPRSDIYGKFELVEMSEEDIEAQIKYLQNVGGQPGA